jgi:excisionase family DNA binding protein
METTEATERFVAAPPLTVAEAARIARVSRSWMWKLIRRGDVEAIRVGETSGPLRVPMTEFLRWLYGSQLPEELSPVTQIDPGPLVEMPEVFDAV